MTTTPRRVDPWLDELARAIWSKAEFSLIPLDHQVVPTRPFSGPAPDPTGLRVVFCGIPSDYGTSFMLHLIARRANLAAVVCSTRWQRTHPAADLLARIAGHIGRPVEIVQNVNSEAFRNCLIAYTPDLIVMASFDQIIGPETLAVPRLGWINIHPSRLPRHRGPEPIYWTIMSGDRTAGITLHWTVDRIDAGPILAQREVPVRRDDTSGTLARRLVEAGLPALDETLERLAAGDTQARQPRLSAGSYEGPVRDPHIDWDQPFLTIDRLVRAGSPDQPPAVVVNGEKRFVRGVRRTARRGREPIGFLGELNGHLLAASQDAVMEVSWRPVGHTHAERPLRRQQFP